MISIPTLSNAEFTLPKTFSRLVDVAYNLWWTWSPEGRALWPAIDPAEWERHHNPIELIEQVDRTHWHTIEQVEAVHDQYTATLREFDRYLRGRETWFQRQQVDLPGPIAYLCTEYGIHQTLPFYSGGLGILAGDHTKSASDMGLPFVAVGLLYRRGYFRQEIDSDGDQQHFYPTLDLRRLPIRPVASPTGGQLRVPIDFPGRTVWAAVWKLDVGTVPLLLLDTDIADNDPSDRPITHQLYVAGREMRFCQELVLGVGAVLALEALGIEPAVWHVNEGHAAMSILERTAQKVASGLSHDEARRQIKERTVFTLHTPVPAGNEVFDAQIAHNYLAPWAARIGVETEDLLALATAHDGESGRFDLGALAIRFASVVNGVSKRHAEVVSRDWNHLIGGDGIAITNGVHTPTWIGRDAGSILVQHVGRSWPSKLIESEEVLEQARRIPDDLIWGAHQSRKEMFARFARGRLRRQLARHGASPDELRAVDSLLPSDRLTLGFARRFATYKRATLMFTDRERLHAILTDPNRPVQIVFAGKAHPADQQGQNFIRQLSELARTPEFHGHIYMLEDYDARMARFMVQGVDVWVNNPRPPMEASGTSGMKAAINGTLNFSVLDGWWLECYSGKNGWSFGSPEENGDWAAQDGSDAGSFYEILANEIAPLYYDRNGAGVPSQWIEWMRESIISSIGRFSTHRMVADYCRQAYFPLALRS